MIMLRPFEADTVSVSAAQLALLTITAMKDQKYSHHTLPVLPPFFALIIIITVGGVYPYIIHRRHLHTFCLTLFVSV